MSSEAKMQFLGNCDGVNWYWAEPGKFENPGVYFWNGKENVRCTPGTVSVKLPEPATEGGRGYRQKVIWVLREALFDAGIKLEVEE